MGSGCLVPSYKVLGRDSAKATGCVIDVLISANNDPGHKDHCLYYFCKEGLSINCLTTALWVYAKAAHPTHDWSFLYIIIGCWTKLPYFNACLKEIAIYFSLDPRRVSSHSLRVVGASSLAAAGVSDLLYHLGYGSLEIPCVLKICATNYRDVWSCSLSLVA